MAKKQTLPRDVVTAVLATADPEEQLALLAGYSADATIGYSKDTLLGTPGCSAELARRLVALGATVNARNRHQATPLHSRAGGWDDSAAVLLELGADVHAVDAAGATPLHAAAQRSQPEAVRLLLAHGAQVDARDSRGRTPLEVALRLARNTDLPGTVVVAELLLAAGAARTPEMPAAVTKLGQAFEFHRTDSEFFRSVEPALHRLCAMFGVEPPVRRVLHDGTAPIVIPSDLTMGERFRYLWDRLVPGSGAAATLQGELVRIVGRLGHEILGNGAANWDADFTAMVDAVPRILATGAPPPAAEVDRVLAAVGPLRAGRADGGVIGLLESAAVHWIEANPEPIPTGRAPCAR